MATETRASQREASGFKSSRQSLNAQSAIETLRKYLGMLSFKDHVSVIKTADRGSDPCYSKRFLIIRAQDPKSAFLI